LLGRDVLAIGIDHYGASAPGEVLAEKFGFTPAAVKSRLAAWK
jgi:transketolase